MRPGSRRRRVAGIAARWPYCNRTGAKPPCCKHRPARGRVSRSGAAPSAGAPRPPSRSGPAPARGSPGPCAGPARRRSPRCPGSARAGRRRSPAQARSSEAASRASSKSSRAHSRIWSVPIIIVSRSTTCSTSGRSASASRSCVDGPPVGLAADEQALVRAAQDVGDDRQQHGDEHRRQPVPERGAGELVQPHSREREQQADQRGAVLEEHGLDRGVVGLAQPVQRRRLVVAAPRCAAAGRPAATTSPPAGTRPPSTA